MIFDLRCEISVVFFAVIINRNEVDGSFWEGIYWDSSQASNECTFASATNLPRSTNVDQDALSPTACWDDQMVQQLQSLAVFGAEDDLDTLCSIQ